MLDGLYVMHRIDWDCVTEFDDLKRIVKAMFDNLDTNTKSDVCADVTDLSETVLSWLQDGELKIHTYPPSKKEE